MSARERKREIVVPYAPRCRLWPPAGVRCHADAVVALVTPEGRSLGFYCQAHADAITAEYREKLGEAWSTQPLKITEAGRTR